MTSLRLVSLVRLPQLKRAVLLGTLSAALQGELVSQDYEKSNISALTQGVL